MDTRIENFTANFRHRIWPAQKHRRDSMRRIQRFISVNGNVSITEIDASHFFRMIDEVEQQGLSLATQNRYVAAVQSVITFARKSRFIPADFKVSVETHKEEHRIRFFSNLELDAIELFCSRPDVATWFRHMCVIGRYTGMRHSEITNLRDPEKASLSLEGNGLWYIHLHKTKNGDKRKVALYKKEAVKAAKSLAKGFKYDHRVFYNTWNQLRARVAPGDTSFVFHVFRHTAASTMANEMRLNSDVIGQWLGHRNPKTTSKYIHIKPETIEDIAIRMAAAG